MWIDLCLQRRAIIFLIFYRNNKEYKLFAEVRDFYPKINDRMCFHEKLLNPGGQRSGLSVG